MNIKLVALFTAVSALACGCGHNHSHDDHDHDHEHTEASHGHDHEGEHDHEHESEEKAGEHNHSGEIVFEHDKAHAAGVEVDTVHPGVFCSVVSTSGRITTSTTDETTVSATVPGIVSLSRQYTEGMPIARGAALFTISSASLPEGDITQRAYIAYKAAKTEYERAVPLAAEKIITDKELQALRTEYETARLAYEAVGRSSGSKGVTITAPSAGYMLQCLVTDGSYVNVGQPLMTITRNRKLMLRAELPESEYAALGRITSAKFKPSYTSEVYDISKLGGRMVSVGKNSAATTSYVPVTFEFDNTSGLIPGSYAEIYLLTDPREGVISVPVSALTEEQGVFYVYIRLDKDCYRKQEVTLGATDGQLTEIKTGLHPGDPVVTKGAIHVKLASASKAIPGHTHNH